MAQGLKGAALLGLSIFVYSDAVAGSVPRILANFPATQDTTIKKAFSERVRASFPRDIRTSTLTALLEMDGFSVVSTGVNHAARFVDTDFPCITDYTLTWGENERGYVTDMQIDMSHKCV